MLLCYTGYSGHFICKPQIEYINRGLIREEKNMAVSYNGLWKIEPEGNLIA